MRPPSGLSRLSLMRTKEHDASNSLSKSHNLTPSLVHTQHECDLGNALSLCTIFFYSYIRVKRLQCVSRLSTGYLTWLATQPGGMAGQSMVEKDSTTERTTCLVGMAVVLWMCHFACALSKGRLVLRTMVAPPLYRYFIGATLMG